ncbi:MAG: 4-hydroxy-tetrahydrodipicolinate reductase [Pseudomonadales bacterium]|nr:4-hydroxy-tetrahydrodipicolinate reductase [Pseudomonadales bacterium]
MTNVAITGAAGRMGQTLVAAIAEHPDIRLTAAIEREGNDALGTDVGVIAGTGRNGVIITDDLAAAVSSFDVLIDFTAATATPRHIEICREHRKKMVIGTTGMSQEQVAALREAGRDIAIVYASNYSVGVNATFKLVEMAAQILGDGYDVEIIEAHHRHKIDAPSGTALSLGEAVCKALGRNLPDVATHGREGITGERDRASIGFHALRGGEIVGEHTVIFASAGERLEITHRAQSRMNFATGAVRAAAFVAGQETGVFDMQDVLGLNK